MNGTYLGDKTLERVTSDYERPAPWPTVRANVGVKKENYIDLILINILVQIIFQTKIVIKGIETFWNAVVLFDSSVEVVRDTF